MFDRFDQLSLRAKIIIGFAMLIALTLVSGGISLVSHRRALSAVETFLDRDNQIAELSLRSNAAMLKARRNEKDFLLKIKEFGYEETKSRYATLVQANLATVRENMAAIRALTDDQDVMEETRAIEQITDRYETSFLNMVELYGRLGRRDAGLEGQFRIRAHAIEALLAEGAPESLMSGLLSLRWAEKNYLLRDSTVYVDAFDHTMDRYREKIGRTPLPEQRKAELLRLTAEYRDLFRQYVAINTTINTTSLTYLGAVHTMEPQLEQLHAHAGEAAAATRAALRHLNQATMQTVAGASLGALLLGLAVAFFISRNFNHTLREIMEFAGNVAEGRLTARLRPGSRNEFGVLIAALNRMAAALQKMQGQLAEASRNAGMAEVATDVLHNVGNVLNSVNVSASLVAERVQQSKVSGLAKVVALLQEHKHDPGAFITSDARGKYLPDYLAQLSEHLRAEQEAIVTELGLLQSNIDHIKDIVMLQQGYAKRAGVKEVVNIIDVLESSVNMNIDALSRHGVEIIREFENVPLLTLDKHKVLHILINLIGNAKYACAESGRTDKRLTLRVANGDGRIQISVIDNGIGIPEENLRKIFNHGFTTRKDGHGFGLHSGALAAQELGGSLSVQSDGLGRGATFTLELPMQTAEPTYA